MPIVPIIDPADYIEREIAIPMEEVRTANPQRGDFEHLNGLYVCDIEQKLAVGVRHIPTDPFWAAGHIPGNPLLPGVLMLEMAAQTSAILAKEIDPIDSFIGFGGVDNCKFRESVTPPAQLYILCTSREHRLRRIVSDTQGIVNGRLVFEACITGLLMK